VWPNVINEDLTLNELVDNGKSICRFGDGELNLALGIDSCVTQPFNIELSLRLKDILKFGNGCLVGIPRMEGPKLKFWSRFNRAKVIELFGMENYYSAFITRPDSAPWIDRADYWLKVQKLWENKIVTLVRGSEKSLTGKLLAKALKVNEIIIPKRDAYNHYEEIFRSCRLTDTILLCAGPTATVLAYDLCDAGHQALDIGHIGMFLGKHIRGEPMIVTDKDKSVDYQ
jgi:hypothetical protein